MNLKHEFQGVLLKKWIPLCFSVFSGNLTSFNLHVGTTKFAVAHIFEPLSVSHCDIYLGVR